MPRAVLTPGLLREFGDLALDMEDGTVALDVCALRSIARVGEADDQEPITLPILATMVKTATKSIADHMASIQRGERRGAPDDIKQARRRVALILRTLDAMERDLGRGA